jgi:putative ABC transport system permease protein
MTVVLLAGTGLLLASVHRMASVPPGFDAEKLGYARLDFRATGWTGRAGLVQRRAVIDDLVARLSAVPGIAAVTAGPPPVGGYANGGFLPDDSPPSPSTTVRAEIYPVRSDFFQVAAIPLVRGRAFGDDDGPGTRPVAIINESAARRFWPDRSAVGRRFRQFAGDADEPPLTIVGVVADVRTINLTREHVQIYRPSAQSFEPSEILFRASGEMAPVIATIRTVVRGLDDRVAMTSAGPVDALFAERSPLGPARFHATFIGLFAATALLTAGIGLYGVLSYAVARRTHEIGVRIALGAGRTRVRWMMAGEVLLPVVVGLAAGVVAALWLSRFIASQLFRVAPRDPLILGAIVLLLVVVSTMAAIVPVRRAVRIEPAVALRDE